MVFYTDSDKERIIINTCNCGCGSELQIKRWVDEETDPKLPVEYYVSLHSSLFDQEQLGIFRLIGRRLKRAWCDLIGKNYLYMDIVFSEQEFADFIETCKNIQK